MPHPPPSYFSHLCTPLLHPPLRPLYQPLALFHNLLVPGYHYFLSTPPSSPILILCIHLLIASTTCTPTYSPTPPISHSIGILSTSSKSIKIFFFNACSLLPKTSWTVCLYTLPWSAISQEFPTIPLDCIGSGSFKYNLCHYQLIKHCNLFQIIVLYYFTCHCPSY